MLVPPTLCSAMQTGTPRDEANRAGARAVIFAKPLRETSICAPPSMVWVGGSAPVGGGSAVDSAKRPTSPQPGATRLIAIRTETVRRKVIAPRVARQHGGRGPSDREDASGTPGHRWLRRLRRAHRCLPEQLADATLGARRL